LFIPQGTGPEITSGYLVSIRKGIIKKLLSANVIDPTTIGIDNSTVDWPLIDDITSIECTNW